MSTRPVHADALTTSTWWEHSTLHVDPLEPSSWIRSLTIHVDGDDDGMLLCVQVCNGEGPRVDVVTQDHSIEDVRRLTSVLPTLIGILEHLPESREPA